VQTLIDIAKHIKADSLTSLPLVERTDGGPDLVTTGIVGDSSIVRPVKAMYDYSDIKSYISSSISADPLVREAAVIDVLNGSGESGLAQEKADELKEIGFKIGKVTNAPSTITEQIKIYQLDEGKSATRAALEKKFNLKIISGQLSDYQTNADFIIVVGQELTN
jgi:hypothetical protein